MFKIVKEPRAWWPVGFRLPGEDGALVDHKFDLRFRLLKVDEAVGFVRDATAASELEEAPEGVDRATLYAGLVEKIADNWREVAGENGEALPWTPENLRLLLNEPGMFVRIFHAFQDCLAGRERLRTGN